MDLRFHGGDEAERHLLGRDLNRAWRTWHVVLFAQAAKRASVQRTLAHLLHRGLSNGWTRWVRVAVDQLRTSQLMARALAGCTIMSRVRHGSLNGRTSCATAIRRWRLAETKGRVVDTATGLQYPVQRRLFLDPVQRKQLLAVQPASPAAASGNTPRRRLASAVAMAMADVAAQRAKPKSADYTPSWLTPQYGAAGRPSTRGVTRTDAKVAAEGAKNTNLGTQSPRTPTDGSKWREVLELTGGGGGSKHRSRTPVSPQAQWALRSSTPLSPQAEGAGWSAARRAQRDLARKQGWAS